MKNWKPDYENTVEETTQGVDPMKELGGYEDDDVHVVEDEKVNEVSDETQETPYIGIDTSNDIFEEEFNKLLEEEQKMAEEEVEILDKEEVEEEVTEEKKSDKKSTPVLIKSIQKQIKTGGLDFNRSTGGSRISKLIGKDNDVQL